MKLVRSDEHRQHFPAGELHNGELVRPFECPERVDYINDALAAAGMADDVAAELVEDSLLEDVHDIEYLRFLRPRTRSGQRRGTLPTSPRPASQRVACINGFPRTSMASSVTTPSLQNHRSATAPGKQHTLAPRSHGPRSRLVSGGADSAFALCRPPGHHASTDFFGGYCYLNNAAIAAQGFRNDGAERVAILDVDFHHGTEPKTSSTHVTMSSSPHSTETRPTSFRTSWGTRTKRVPGRRGLHRELSAVARDLV